jgi:hypothetical protein
MAGHGFDWSLYSGSKLHQTHRSWILPVEKRKFPKVGGKESEYPSIGNLIVERSIFSAYTHHAQIFGKSAEAHL